MKIYTRQGDDGTTGLLGGRRVSKDDPRIAACGAVDELNAALGLAAAACDDADLAAVLARFQSELFDLGAELARPPQAANRDTPQPSTRLSTGWIECLEKKIDALDADLPPLKNFILPGGGELAARLHFARATCRRAERDCITLARAEPVGPTALTYLNRLGDLLFVMARHANQRAGIEDVLWTGRE